MPRVDRTEEVEGRWGQGPTWDRPILATVGAPPGPRCPPPRRGEAWLRRWLRNWREERASTRL